MQQLDYGKEYRYAHNEPDAYAAGETYFPDEISSDAQRPRFYAPTGRGLEGKIGEKLNHLQSLDQAAQSKKPK